MLNADAEQARQVYEQAVEQDPSNADAWLRLAYTARDARSALEYIQRAVDLKPNDPAIQSGLRHILFNRLRRDPFVQSLAETEWNYVVTLRDSRPIVIPKVRFKSELYPPPKLSEGERLARMVGWMALGLTLVGAGALVLAPVVIRRALRVLNTRGTPRPEYRRALVTLIQAAVLGLMGEALFGLFLLHWIG